VGLLVTRIARRLGARVFGTVGSAAKVDAARAAGAEAVIVYTEQDFAAEVKRLTGGEGVDVVYDSVGRDTFDRSLDCLKPRGYLVLLGFTSGPVAPFDPALLGVKGSLFLTRPGLPKYIATREELLGRARDLFRWIGSGDIVLKIDRVLPLADAAEAHRALESRRTTGKLLLVP
jgi:NADPH2:quinone reductase